MKNFKIMLSVFMVFTIILTSVVPTLAIIAPEDSASNPLNPVNKMDEVLLEKISTIADNERIPVWVWLTDIDTDELENAIEIQTGLSQQTLVQNRAQINDNATVSTLSSFPTTSTDDKLTAYLSSTKTQREELADDTQVYLAAKKTLAKQRYETANTSKIRQLGISTNKINYQSKLTPSFIAYLTKDEILETAQSANVVEMGYFDEYDEEISPESIQTNTENESPTEEPTINIEENCTPIKQALQYNEAFQKYGCTGEKINILHIDNNYVVDDFNNYGQIPHPENVINVMQKQTFTATQDFAIPFNNPDNPYPNNNHANCCVSYLQTFAKDVYVFVVAKNSRFSGVNSLPLNDPRRINTYDDIEYIIDNNTIDIINASCNDGTGIYNSSFSARWYDAIVVKYSIPLIASAGNSYNSEYQLYDAIAPASGYNSIAVGVYGAINNRMYPDYRYNHTNMDNRVSYKPDLICAANGFGTSAAAPTISALVAMMMQQDASIKGYPELIKAILMASCHKKALPGKPNDVNDPAELMETGLTPKQGAGEVNALRAMNIVAFGTYGYTFTIPDYNIYTVENFNLNSQVYGNSNTVYPVNVSIAWLRESVKTSNNDNENDTAISLGDRYEIDLQVVATNQNGTSTKISDKTNAGKQMVFFSNPDLDTQYSIKVSWNQYSNINRTNLNFAYAYSVGNFEKALEKVEITGPTAVGKTLTANAYTADGLIAESSALTYQWYEYIDKDNRQLISGATSPTYLITESDINKRFICEVEQNYMTGYKVSDTALTSVFRYGDADMDGDVSALDATEIQLYLADMVDFTQEQYCAADIDLDGVVTINDVNSLQLYLAGLIPSIPVEQTP
ncbi:MAG: hypothetical protein IJ331_00325 [Ruminococcus sp.]|nr:hypothetical protein [Ruminococcus sp.]